VNRSTLPILEIINALLAGERRKHRLPNGLTHEPCRLLRSQTAFTHLQSDGGDHRYRAASLYDGTADHGSGRTS
jgi:hypothetical protein